ncbi:hypothetical protein F4805DRAFT_248773 [Annulohypoxylon moriforme]|nr:hypothetical protein F4805DRAFT_248773 [Annulohypoxylon moriforme]
MAPVRSDEANQGSVGVGSSRSSVEPAGYASDRVARSMGYANMPVNALLPLGAPTRRNHTELLGSIDNLLGGQYHGGALAAAAPETAGSASVYSPANGRRPSVENALTGVGSRFDGPNSSSQGSSGSAERQ